MRTFETKQETQAILSSHLYDVIRNHGKGRAGLAS